MLTTQRVPETDAIRRRRTRWLASLVGLGLITAGLPAFGQGGAGGDQPHFFPLECGMSVATCQSYLPTGFVVGVVDSRNLNSAPFGTTNWFAPMHHNESGAPGHSGTKPTWVRFRRLHRRCVATEYLRLRHRHLGLCPQPGTDPQTRRCQRQHFHVCHHPRCGLGQSRQRLLRQGNPAVLHVRSGHRPDPLPGRQRRHHRRLRPRSTARHGRAPAWSPCQTLPASMSKPNWVAWSGACRPIRTGFITRSSMRPWAAPARPSPTKSGRCNSRRAAACSFRIPFAAKIW